MFGRGIVGRLLSWLGFKSGKPDGYVSYKEAMARHEQGKMPDRTFSRDEWLKLAPEKDVARHDKRKPSRAKLPKDDIQALINSLRAARTPAQLEADRRKTEEQNESVQLAQSKWDQITDLRRRGHEIPYRMHRAAHQFDLLTYTHPDISHVRIKATPHGNCPACRALAEKVFPLASEIRSPHLPVVGCTCPGDWCSCYYEVVFNDEL